jgi:hypothetical protein
MSSTAVGGSFFINVALAKAEAFSFGALPFTERPQTVGLMCQSISERKGWLPILTGRGLLLEDLTFYLVAGDKAPTTVPSVDTMAQLRSTDATTNLASGCFIIAVLPAIATVLQGQTNNTPALARDSSAPSAVAPANAAAARGPDMPVDTTGALAMAFERMAVRFEEAIDKAYAVVNALKERGALSSADASW